MRCFLYHCNGYKIIREVTVQSFAELPAMCLAAETATNDGYAVLASHNSQLVADSEGIWTPANNHEGSIGYAHACGYRD